ncbi:sigma-70 family RNA polymerase sigma factor [Engelhardtia mirabilis]|uniref:RNA polymerase sigma factor SigV n=1 Tax=Engelhardtia mirabilis TaxID=2528011 RepID=A0A518BSG3_9BACT|nr:RNA polymerase sigma factor SigV [Planctomycetes bacterium Pla133]QDV04238.1 RNA polymerase sigma factor SigV [Planctomycetes bacterium Pla86]
MDTTARTIDPSELLEHADWMRALAKRLVLDSDFADDVVQEAWAAALARPPRQGVPLGAWLATVVRNKALVGRRTAGRRSARERDAARGEAIPSTAELSERAELQGLLAERIGRLPEPYREVVLLRYFEDLKPAAIAEHLGVPVNTVNTRHARAMDRMRRDLDALHGGDRRRWCLGLIPLAAMDRGGATLLSSLKTTVMGALIVSHPLKAAVASALLVVVAGGGLYAWNPTPPVEVPGAGEELGPVTLSTSSGVAPSAAVAVASSAPTAREEVAALDRVVRGRVTDLDGATVAGVAIRSFHEVQGGTVSELSATSGADGTFEWPLAADDDWPTLRAQADGYIGLRMRAPTGPDEPTQLRVTPLHRAPIEIRVTNLSSGETVPRFTLRCSTNFGALPDADQYLEGLRMETLDGLAAGEVEFAAGLPMVVRVELLAGAVRTVELEQVVTPMQGQPIQLQFEVDLDGPERAPGAVLATGRVIDAQTLQPVAGARIELLGLVDESEAIQTERQVQSMLDGHFRIAFDEGGPRGVVIANHPHYEPASLSFDGSGPIEVPMVRRASLRVRLVDGAGNNVAGGHLLLRSSSNAYVDYDGPLDERATTGPDGVAVFEHLRPGGYMIHALRDRNDADENAVVRRSLEIEAGVPLELELALGNSDQVTVTGTVTGVVDPPGAVVPYFLSHGADGTWVRGAPEGLQYRATDLRAGRYVVLLGPAIDDHMDEVLMAILPAVELSGEASQAMDLRYPALRFSGRLSGVDDPRSLTVIAMPVLPPGLAADLLGSDGRRMLEAAVDDAGAFTLPPLGAGEFELRVERPWGERLAARPLTVSAATPVELPAWDLGAR